MAALRVLLAARTLLVFVVVAESAVITAQNLQLIVGDSLVFSNPNQVYPRYQSCDGKASIHVIPPGTNHTMTTPESTRTLYAGHCTEGQKMKVAVLPSSTIVSNPSDADVNRYICWTTAVLLIVACFWNSS